MVLVLPDHPGYSHRVSRREFVLYFGYLNVADAIYQSSYGRADVVIFRKENSEIKALNKKLKERREIQKKIRDVSIPVEKRLFQGRKTFTWEKISYTVPAPGSTRHRLYDVDGYIEPGTLTALMGTSDTGKMTALDVLAQRKNIGVITGDLLVDGKQFDPSFAHDTTYGPSSVRMFLPEANHFLEQLSRWTSVRAPQ